jgi:hypothetical protein
MATIDLVLSTVALLFAKAGKVAGRLTATASAPPKALDLTRRPNIN